MIALHRPRRPGRPTRSLGAALLLVAAIVAGCDALGTSPAPTGGSPGAVTPRPSPMTVPQLLANPLDLLNQPPVVVDGFLWTDGTDIFLCATLTSTNPRGCGEPRIDARGVIPDDVIEQLDSVPASGAGVIAWGQVQVTGRIRLDELAIEPWFELQEIRVVDAGVNAG